MNHLLLSNGLSVLLHQMPNTHSITLGLYVRCGSAYEEECIAGITHLLEHLHFRKLGFFSQDELYYKMECMGSSLRATTYRNFLKFTMKIIPEKFAECIIIFKNLIETIEWGNDEFQKEKQVVINQIFEKGNYISIEKEVQKLVFKDHPLSRDIMGEWENVERLTEADVTEYKKKMFTSENILVCITGNVNEMNYINMLKDLQTAFISKSTMVRKINSPECFHNRKPDILFKEIQDSNPLEVNISFDITYDKKTKDLLTILNCILGEGVGSRLQKSIREERCYSSDIFSYIEWYENFAVLHVRFLVEKRVFYDCFNQIITILKEMKCSIVKRDLDVTLPFYTTNQIFNEDDTEEMNFQLAYNEFVLGMEYRSVKLDNSESTILCLQKLAKNVFIANNMSVVLVGNTKTITKKSITQIISNL